MKGEAVWILLLSLPLVVSLPGTLPALAQSRSAPTIPADAFRPTVHPATSFQQSPDDSKQAPRRVALAMGLSLVVPGAGQVYNRHWIKAGVTALIEGLVWTGYGVWKGRGIQMQEEYRTFARHHWNPVRYDRWLNQYEGYTGSAISTDAVSNIALASPETWTREERQRIAAFIQDIREAESEARYVSTNASFSHQLPEVYTQQYYELIGKYGQYAPGWDDCSGSCTINHPSDRFSAYAAKRARANDLLRRASRLVLGAVANHIVAAADAAVSAHLHNVDVRSSLAISPGEGNQYHTLLAVRLSF